MKWINKRFIACTLIFCMLLSMLPSNVFAKDPVSYGDVNKDGTVDKADVDDLEKYLAEYNISIDLDATDVNADGVIDLRDLLLLKQYVAGLPVILGQAVTVTFYTDGSPVDPIKLCKGATLASVVDKMPVTQKDGYVFAGWKTRGGNPFYAEDVIESNVDVYAYFEKIEDQMTLSISSFSLEDQSPDLSFTICADSVSSVAEVRKALSLITVDGSDPVELDVQKVTDTEFTIKAKEGFNEGASYQLTLADGFNFKGKEKSICTANFTIHKEEVDNLTYNEDIIYIKDTEEIDYMLTGHSESVPVLETSMLSNKDSNEAVTGYFYYSDSSISEGAILCIYENVHPLNRDYTSDDYSDDAASYVEVIKVEGTKISFKSINEEDADKVIVIPDTIPFSVETLPTKDSGTVSTLEYDKDAWVKMGYTGEPKFNVGDFIVFYTGNFADITEDSEVYFGKVTAVNGNEITYVETTAEEIQKSQDMFVENPVGGDELLENVDTEVLEEQIEQQALKSGFAEEAANYLANAAQETDGFKNMKLTSFSAKAANGTLLSPAALKNIGKSWEISDDIKVTATIGKSSKYFKDGISLSLRIDAEFSVDVGEEGEMKIDLSATFTEEISVDIDINANAKVKWIVIIPKFESITFGASVDIKNYSAISLDVKIYSVEKEDEGTWEKLKAYKGNKKLREYLEHAEEIKEKIDEARETADKIKGYKEDLENLWKTIKNTSKTMPEGELTQESFEMMLETLGQLNVTKEMNELLNLTTDEEMEAGVQDLMERYSEMLETESDWISLVNKEIFSQDIHISIFAINISMDFVVKANVNIALGANLEYVVGKRYSFWIDIVKKTSGSSTMDLLDEKFAFQFYVMGALGIRMGVEAGVRVGIISTKIGSIGVTAEFGPYLKLWGYFIYEYSKMRPAGTNAWNYDERMMGALYLEFGLYLEVAFEAQVLDGAFSYNPTLADKEFPLVTAGDRKNYYGFAYDIDDDEVLIVDDEDKNSNNGISMTLPESYCLMNYMDLVEGNLEHDVVDYSNFIATLSNRNFHIDNNTGLITVDVPDGVQYMDCDLTLTWKKGKLEFLNRDITMTIPLVWTSLSTEELNQKFTATVKVGNKQDGYMAVWSTRVKKNAFFNLPTEEEILDIIGYDSYNRGNENLKYENVLGYGAQQTTDLAIYADTTYYFDVIPKEYTLTVKGVQNADGTLEDRQFKAKYGEKFDLTELLSSGARNAADGNYTAYLKTEATLNGSKEIGTGKDKRDINQDITRVIDSVFATDILSGVEYTAKYVDNSVTATFTFVGKNVNVADKTVKIEKGTIPPDIFTEELSQNDIIVKSITPALGNITVDTNFTVSCENTFVPSFRLTYHTNDGTSIPQTEVKQGSMLIAPADPIRTGYGFGGWYTDEGLKNPFDFTGAVMPGNDLDLYAKWIGETYEVSFDANEGMLPEGTQTSLTVTYGEPYGNLPIPVRTGYKFLGWYTDRTGGSKISSSDKVAILRNTEFFAHWQEKQTINANIITYSSGQKTTYNRKNQPFNFSAGSIPSGSFEVYYKRQGLDTSYATEAINAGTYDIKFVHQEDENYKYFETVLKGVYTIEKAESSILTAPSVAEVYYDDIIPRKMVSDVDYIGDGELQYGVGTKRTILGITETTPPDESDWVSGDIVYNVNDKKNDAANVSLYLWVRHAESENYKASKTKISTEKIKITNKPKTILSSNFGGNENLTYEIWIKTSNKDDAGTNSKISIKIGDGVYQHLDNKGDDFEKNALNKFKLTINDSLLYNTCYGTIPVTLKYEKSGNKAGWHCEYVKLNVYRNGTLVVDGDKYTVNHWFGAEDYNQSLIEETYNLTGYERIISSWNGDFTNDDVSSLKVEPTSDDFTWSWNNPSITDSRRGVTYDPYRYLNSPELSVSFNNKKYNRYITQGIRNFKLDSKELYKAMVADGVSELDLTYTLEFKPVNGNRSVTADTSVRTKTIKVTCKDALPELLSSNTSYMLSKSAKALFSLNNKKLTSISPEVTTGLNGTFDVSYRIGENVGIWGTKFAVNYDSTKVEMIGYTLGDIFVNDEVTPPQSYGNGRYVFFASRDTFDDITKTGKLVTLHFKIKDGANLSDYPVYMDTTAFQSVNAESGIVSLAVNSNAAKIRVSGNTSDIRNQDTVTVSANEGNSEIKNVQVKKDNGDFTDITETYMQGYTINENGTYTFKLITTDGEIATTSITYTMIDTVKPVVVIDAGAYEENKWATGSVMLSARNTANNLGTTSIMYRIGENGEWNSYSEPITVNAENCGVDAAYYFKAMSESGVESDVVEYNVKLDNKAPSGEIRIGENRWTKLLNNITFGLFFKNTQSVDVTSSDAESGVNKTYYYITHEELSETEVNKISDWTECNGSFSIEPNDSYVVYVKIIDKVGNSSIINTNGLVLDNIIPSISGVKDGETYCSAVKVTVTDDNLDIVKLNGNDILSTEGDFTVYPDDKVQTITAIDKAGNEKTVSITVRSDHSWDEGVVTIAPTASEKGVRTYTCIVCGETKTEEIDKITPEIIEGESLQWTQGGSGTLTFRSNASFNDFINVLVDGEVIGSENYDLREGSIIVTLKADYLATLSAGTHTVGIQSVTGTATTEFKIVTKEEEKDPVKPGDLQSPQSGDNSNMLLLIALLFVSGSTLIALGVKRKKVK